ncbi:MAG: hypothetical protein IKE94_05680 [Aeriscardovia sp.]|nr:hypothetical protein [Aeriscardovia sp.]
MDYKLNVNHNGEVDFIQKAGSAYVKTTIPEGRAKALIATAKSVEKSDKYDNFIVLNDNEAFIAGELLADEKPKIEELLADEKPKIEEKTFEDPKPDVKNFGKKFHPKKKH